MDLQLAQLNGEPQVWHNQGFDARFNLGELGDTVGYGHTAEQACAVVVEDAALLVEYLDATTATLSEYIAGLSEADLDDVIDTSWTPHVSARGAAGEHDRRCRPARGTGSLCGGHSRGRGCHLGQGGVVAVSTSGID